MTGDFPLSRLLIPKAYSRHRLSTDSLFTPLLMVGGNTDAIRASLHVQREQVREYVVVGDTRIPSVGGEHRSVQPVVRVLKPSRR